VKSAIFTYKLIVFIEELMKMMMGYVGRMVDIIAFYTKKLLSSMDLLVRKI